MSVTNPMISTSLSWETHDCDEMKGILPICQYPQLNLTQAFPQTKGKYDYF